MSTTREVAERLANELFPNGSQETSIVGAIDKALQARDERAAKIADLWADAKSCTIHEADPCCHVRTGAAIAKRIRERSPRK